MRKLVLAAIVVGVAVATSVGVVLGSGGGSTTTIKASASADLTVPMHRVSAPSRGVATPTAKRPHHRAKAIYLETNPFTLHPGDSDGATGKCPKRSTAISGYFGADHDFVVPIYDAVGISLRKWTVVVKNQDATDDTKAFVGTVCLKP